ncbi:MAG: response regulator [Polyangiaceae bacterium]|nr:response regulator [Polyangiaceae bacterium]
MSISKVLVVDDEPDLRTISRLSLERVGGWKTFLAGSGKEALEVAERELPDVILLDVMMPGMDGPTTLLEIRKRAALANIRVVFLTAKVQKHEVQAYVEMGASGVIPKPFDPMKLPSELRRLLGEEG